MSQRGPFKTQGLELLRDRGVPVGTVLDVGVCHATPELIQAFPKCKHVLFEPVEEFLASIRHNYRNLNYELHHAAVSDTDGTVSLKTSEAVQDIKGVSHSAMGEDGAPGTRQVPKLRLDTLMANRSELPEPYLLKIDIDGQELKALRGATETMKKCSIVIVECQRSELVPRIAEVRKAGFALFDLAEPCYYDGVFWQCDAIMIRHDFLAQKFEALTNQVKPGMYQKFQ
jgi:FkbM family methyltransferase